MDPNFRLPTGRQAGLDDRGECTFELKFISSPVERLEEYYLNILFEQSSVAGLRRELHHFISA